MGRPKILIVDDEEVIRQLFKRSLGEKDYDIQTADNGEQALLKSKKSFFNLLILDLKMPGMRGEDVLKEVKKFNPYIEVIIVTGYPTVDTAVDAIKIGAFDFICKPIDMEKMHIMIERCLERQKFGISNIKLSELTTLFEVTKTVSASINLDSLLGRVLDSALKMTHAKKGSLLISDEKNKDLQIKITKGFSDGKRSIPRIGFGEGISGRVAEEGKPMIITSIDDDPRLKIENLPAWEARSFLGAPLASIPLSSQGKTLGVINIADKISGESFTEREQTMLSVLAGQAAIAIENVKLYNQLQNKVETLKRTINELNKTQNQLVQTAKMVAVGNLLFSIAHEIRNPLAIILSGIEFLDEEFPEKNRLSEESIEKIKQSVKRANNIITDLLKFSRTSKLGAEPVNVCTLMDQAITLVKNQADMNNVKLARNFSEDDIQIKADSNMLRQTFLNLVINAIDAMPHGGKLAVNVHREKDKGRVIVKIADTGAGIPKENLEKIFDPFFTTKTPGKGTGLGLSIVRLILERHNATIDVESEVNKGTKFTISLPEAKNARSRSKSNKKERNKP